MWRGEQPSQQASSFALSCPSLLLGRRGGLRSQQTPAAQRSRPAVRQRLRGGQCCCLQAGGRGTLALHDRRHAGRGLQGAAASCHGDGRGGVQGVGATLQVSLRLSGCPSSIPASPHHHHHISLSPPTCSVSQLLVSVVVFPTLINSLPPSDL